MTKLVQTDTEAEAQGFAGFNRNPHLCVDVPNGGFTITAKTSEGKRITFAFVEYEAGGAPQCVDVQYHDNGTDIQNCPTFDFIGFTKGGRLYSTQGQDSKNKASLVAILINNDMPEGGK